MMNLMNASFSDLLLVDEIGERIAESLIEYFSDINNIRVINSTIVNNTGSLNKIFNFAQSSPNFVLTKMLFGKYKGKLIKNLPDGYKDWLVENACHNGRNRDLLQALQLC